MTDIVVSQIRNSLQEMSSVKIQAVEREGNGSQGKSAHFKACQPEFDPGTSHSKRTSTYKLSSCLPNMCAYTHTQKHTNKYINKCVKLNVWQCALIRIFTLLT